MKVLVTGGAGFIGSHLVDALVEKGHQVRVVDDLSSGKKENRNAAAIYSVAKIQELNPKNHKGYDVVFHLAAKARIQPSIDDPISFDKANVHGTLIALEIARRCGAKFIFSSSSSVYGPRDLLPEIETDMPYPQNPYALQKLMGEMYVQLYQDLYGLRATTFRYFNVFGERQLEDGAYATVLGIFARQKRDNVPFTIVDDGEQRRDFTYVKDVVAANILAMEDAMTDGQLYNVGTGTNTSVNQIAAAIDKDHPCQRGVKRATEVRATLADSSLLYERGWKPSISVLEWIESKKV